MFAAAPDVNKQNVATSLVNAMLNTGFGNDKMMINADENATDWVNKNKDTGKIMMLFF